MIIVTIFYTEFSFSYLSHFDMFSNVDLRVKSNTINAPEAPL